MPLPIIGGLLTAARALPLLSQIGTAARVVGAGAKGKAGSATNAVSNILQQESRAARLTGLKNARKSGTTQLDLFNPIPDIPQVLKSPQAYSQASQIVADNPFLKTAYSAGNVLNTAGKAAGPVGTIANVGLTGAFVAPMLFPQGQAEYATEPFNNAYTQLPTPSGGMYPTDQRGAEMVGGMQATAMMNDGQGVAPYGLTDEQIVKAKRRAEETAQLNQLYASTLQQYQQPY